MESAFIRKYIFWTKVIGKQLEGTIVIANETQRNSFPQMAAGVFLSTVFRIKDNTPLSLQIYLLHFQERQDVVEGCMIRASRCAIVYVARPD